ncbi:hypothetical protein H7J88_23870 [Mycolicibacterium flavescens]|uniref:Secreted protein n=1 Tax=Mycolicibacterium flavescens TaxID=1776 RepID=A0A1E3RED7_MYCFV|nr:hypothetical protein [Mycolicibacterium flavescens]MCV7282679.1 hypothetical protein [Mycolicibacterium flavescens]ODQ88204.1 hypothetical protein BHQ18_20380 [Mycolicibacterium flavescens]
MSLKHIAARTTLATAAGLGALLLSSGVAVAEPPRPVPAPAPAPGTENRAAEEQPREEKPAEPCRGDWCEILNAAKQLPAPNWGAVDVPKLAEVSVPVSFGMGLPDVVPDITVAPPAIGWPDFPAPQLQAPPMPKLQLPPAPKLQLPGPPKLKLGMPKFPW